MCQLHFWMCRCYAYCVIINVLLCVGFLYKQRICVFDSFIYRAIILYFINLFYKLPLLIRRLIIISLQFCESECVCLLGQIKISCFLDRWKAERSSFSWLLQACHGQFLLNIAINARLVGRMLVVFN